MKEWDLRRYKLLAFRHQSDTGRAQFGQAGRYVTEALASVSGKGLIMHPAVKRRQAEFKVPRCPVDSDIRDFLAGRTDGEDLLHALYDHVLDEPVPERLRALLRC